jgi:hypothetical protein
MTFDTSSKIKVAVIGSGLAGLTAEVHLFEKAPTLGMDAASISVHPGHNSSKKNIRIDVRYLRQDFIDVHIIRVIKLTELFALRIYGFRYQ